MWGMIYFVELVDDFVWMCDVFDVFGVLFDYVMLFDVDVVCVYLNLLVVYGGLLFLYGGVVWLVGLCVV